MKTLRVKGLDSRTPSSAIMLQTQNVSVSGKIDGRSTLRLNSPDGVVMLNASVAGHSSVEIDATGGHVRFDSAIDGGSTVTITAQAWTSAVR